MLTDQTVTKQEQDPEDIKKSSTGTKKQTKEEPKIKADKDTNNNGVSDNLHKNENPPNKSEV